MEAKCCSKCKHALTLDRFKIRGNSRTKSCIGCLAKAKGKRRTKCKDHVIEHEVDPLAIDVEIRELEQDENYILLYTLLTYNIIPEYIELGAPHEGPEKSLLVKMYRKVLRCLQGKLIYTPLPIDYKTMNTKLCPAC